MKFENKKPTDAEKLMFEHMELYLMPGDEYRMVTRYVPVHTEKLRVNGFPKEFELPDDAVELDAVVTFDEAYETVKLNGDECYDIDSIRTILMRMEELGFARVFLPPTY